MILFFILFGNRFKKLGVILYQNEVQNCSGRTGGSNLELPWRGKTGQGTSKGMYYLNKIFFHDQRIFITISIFLIFHSFVSPNMLKKNPVELPFKILPRNAFNLKLNLDSGPIRFEVNRVKFREYFDKKNFGTLFFIR